MILVNCKACANISTSLRSEAFLTVVFSPMSFLLSIFCYWGKHTAHIYIHLNSTLSSVDGIWLFVNSITLCRYFLLFLLVCKERKGTFQRSKGSVYFLPQFLKKTGILNLRLRGNSSNSLNIVYGVYYGLWHFFFYIIQMVCYSEQSPLYFLVFKCLQLVKKHPEIWMWLSGGFGFLSPHSLPRIDEDHSLSHRKQL